MLKILSIPLLFLTLLVSQAQERIVSLSPNLTEIIYKLGQEKSLVGRSSACNYPPEASKLKIAGSFGKLYLEPLAALNPTLVISEKTWDNTIPDTLKKFGIRYQIFDSNSLEDYLKIVTELGKLLNCPDKAAELVNNTRAELDNIRRTAHAVPLEQRPKVLVVISDAPIFTVGKNSYITEMIETAGGRNVAAAVDKGYFDCSLEWLTQANPDILIMPLEGHVKLQNIKENPAWQGLNAVKNNHILTDIESDQLYRLGPRTLDGIRKLQEYFSSYKAPK